MPAGAGIRGLFEKRKGDPGTQFTVQKIPGGFSYRNMAGGYTLSPAGACHPR